MTLQQLKSVDAMARLVLVLMWLYFKMFKKEQLFICCGRVRTEYLCILNNINYALLCKYTVTNK
jgi:hypothetical protein